MPEPTSIRLTDETKANLARLSEHLGIKSKSLLIELAIRRMARTELPESPQPKRKAKR
jgi:predicted DNA-binding protein